MFDNLIFYTKHSFNDLKSNGRRTLFALLCIAAGVAAIVSLQTLGVMIEDTLTGSLRESNRADMRILPQPDFGDDVSFNEATRDRDDIVEQAGEFEFYFTPEGVQKITEWLQENYEGEFDISYQQSQANSNAGVSISIPARDSDKGVVQSFFIEADQYPLFGERRTEEDQPLSEVLNEPTDIVISRNLADDLGAEIGDKIRLSRATQDFTLTGIVATDEESGFENFLGSIFGYYYLDVSAVPLFEDLQPGEAIQLFVGLENSEDVDPVSEAFQRRYPYLNNITTTDLEEQNSQISNAVGDLVIVMGLVSMLIGGIGIVNTMLVIVSRRTTEVAVLKTIGLEPEQVTLLFLVEAILMGIAGSLLGIVLGWVMTYVLKGVASQFVAQTLSFRIAFDPAFNGFIVGIIITAIFGFLPTLAAGQVRPATVLRPSETVIPQNGRLRSFAALMVVVASISVVAQGLIGDLLGSGAEIKIFAAVNGVIIGLLMTIPMIIGGFLEMRRGSKGRSWPLRIFLIWPAMLLFAVILGAAFGYFITTLPVISITFILVGCLYLLLLLLIWAVGGGQMSEFPILGVFPAILRVMAFVFFVLWTGFLAFVLLVIEPEPLYAGLFLGLLFFIHIPAVLVTLTLPGWALGQLLQRFGFLDLKVALRAMVSTKARGASMLLALVIGVFTLSVITMLVTTIIDQFNRLVIDEIGGNVLIFAAGGEETLTQVETTLDQNGGVNSYTVIRNFDTEFVSLEDVSKGETLKWNDLEERVLDKAITEELGQDSADSLRFSFNGIDARRIESNLPDIDLYAGRQLDPARDIGADADGYYPIVISASQATIDAGFEVGDLLTFSIGDSRTDRITFKIVGMLDKRSGDIGGMGAANYTLVGAFGDRVPAQVYGVADVDEDQIRNVRRALAEIPGVFVLETKLLNELITAVVNQFTLFPRLVAALALLTGGIVIANAVALSTLERRREIGIMKAVGLQRERVIGMLLLENGLMGLIGGLIGVGISVIILLLMLTQIFQGELGNAIPYTEAFLLMGLCIAIALIAAVISVWGASGEKPLNVLRYE